MNSKEILRTLLKARRAQISLERREEASERIVEELYPTLKDSPYVLSFASTKEEINLWPLNALLCEEKRLLLPRVEGDSLGIYHVDTLKHLVISKSGVLEPDPLYAKPYTGEDVVVALIPGLGFDDAHHRLGYGGGYFDKTLLKLHKVISIGVGFVEQLVEQIPQEEHDQRLHGLFLV